MPEKPLPEVAVFQAFLSGRVRAFGDRYAGWVPNGGWLLPLCYPKLIKGEGLCS
jgi:hypothetical protein